MIINKTTNPDVKKGTAMVLGCVRHKSKKPMFSNLGVSIILTVTPKKFMLFQICVKTESHKLVITVASLGF